MNPVVNIHRHRLTDDFVLMDFAFDPEVELIASTGLLRHIDAATFQTDGLRAVLDSLAGFDGRGYELGEFGRWTARQKADFDRDRDLVVARRRPTGDVALTPMQAVAEKAGASMGIMGGVVVVGPPITPARFWTGLLTAFSRCSS